MSLLNKFFTAIILSCGINSALAQGWPANYEGVMLQGFYWDSFTDSKWTTLEKQADELSKYFTLIWIPQSGNCSGTSMGYNPKYYWDQNSSFGTESQLRSMIKTFKDKGLGTIADVVINHRQNLSSWVDFPAETYNGVTYQMVSTDICSDDDEGNTKTWADEHGYQLSSNKDSGEGWSGMRDLDHASENVQKCIFAYEDFLLNDLCYTGFRYDVAKGFAEKYFALYNNHSKPQFSVGECWDNTTRIKTWINKTKTDGTNTYDEPQSAAFDFDFRYRIRDAINQNNWKMLTSSDYLVKNDSYKRYAVTFVENHDTEKRATDNQDPIKGDTLAANAVILAMPGTPCVFFKHWQAYRKDIKKMIEARHLVGINNQSSFTELSTSTSLCEAIEVTGTKGKLIFAVGPTASSFTKSGYKVLLSGKKYKYLVDNATDTTGWKATMDYIDQTTVDPEPDPEPTVSIPDFCKLEDGKVVAFFEAPDTWTNTIKCWCWDDTNASKNYTGGTWPGTACTKIGTANDGNAVWKWSYDSSAFNATKPMIIFNNSGSPQTDNLTFVNGGYYTKDGLFDTVTAGIEAVTTDVVTSTARYNLQGVRVDNSYKGIVVRNGKKYLAK